MKLTRRRLGALAALVATPASAETAGAETAWNQTLARARGQSVAFNAWAGDEATNAFLVWADARLQAQYGVTLRHVRLRDTGEAVARVIAERSAGRDSGGSVDMIWLNGANFLALKQQGLLRRFAGALPNFALVDTVGKPATVTDFTVPVEGLAAPWRMAQIVFIHDTARLPEPPRTMRAMADWAGAHRGRLAHPTVRNFLGATFLKQALHELTPDPVVLQSPATPANVAPVTAAMWEWYTRLRPSLWRQGRQFPENGPACRNLLSDGEIDLMVSFNPSEAANDIATGLLPPSVRGFTLEGGTIGNASFVAIPGNAAAPDAAAVVANFLLSPLAQAHAQDPTALGSFTVLDLARLSARDRGRFDSLPQLAGMMTNAELGHPLAEPHPSWMTAIAAEWERRTSAG